MALQEQADIALSPERQAAAVQTTPEMPSLISSRQLRVSDEVVRTTLQNGPALSFQALALAHLIDDLLKTETGTRSMDENDLAEPRLPGENANDTLRYLLRGLRRELHQFDRHCRGVAGDDAVAARRLDRLQQFGMGVVGALRNVPSSGAGDAVSALIGGFLDQAGLQPWDTFLSQCPMAPASVKPEAARSESQLVRDIANAKEETERAVVASAVGAPEGDPMHSLAGQSEDAASAFRPPAECEAEDPLEIPLMLVRPIHGDWARVLVKKGLGYLTKCYGEPAETLKPLLKTWVAQSGHDHKKVFKLIAEAQARNEPDPKNWVGRHLAEQAPA